MSDPEPLPNNKPPVRPASSGEGSRGTGLAGAPGASESRPKSQCFPLICAEPADRQAHVLEAYHPG